ncbi:hypothetical protein [Agaribacterium haliotis]|uniref:hypothetical protein n=1 Tax=Agaribacterium haliotis TaxID=2013869 RepID=UPI001177D8EC|nr:hypothetical protein [Agaribacterium haliotis]
MKLLLLAPLYCCLTLQQLYAQTGEVLYRYVNEHGVPVINHSIPARYAQKGYEILNRSGEVIKVVAPAPSQDEIAEAEQRRNLLAEFKILKRRYSSIDDIEQAKQRKLDSITTNIRILNGTISNLESNIDDLVSNAAVFERKGRAVPENLLNQIKDARAELDVSKDMLDYRQQEFNDTAKKYDEDIRTFIHGEKLEKELASDMPDREPLTN